ncbi:hypothetical protein DCAR_0205779 [Daucus carota subsp. sativus]|uniref:Uncharacterized protein n=1 Tax=Daucus carota subsp. sativus TaxID=79200 RepID=A0A166CU10_DAUCS|nr:hypothetical protein DCAR_0205779 [Daucus carota subsp. sativus]
MFSMTEVIDRHNFHGFDSGLKVIMESHLWSIIQNSQVKANRVKTNQELYTAHRFFLIEHHLEELLSSRTIYSSSLFPNRTPPRRILLLNCIGVETNTGILFKQYLPDMSVNDIYS